MSLFQAVFVPLCTAGAIWFIVRVLRGRLPRRQGLLWSLVWTAAAGLIAVPMSTSMLAQSLGIGRGSDLVFYVAVLVGLSAGVYFYNRYRSLEIMLTELVRQQALERVRRGPSHRDRQQSENSPRTK